MDITDELERLSKLRQDGSLTEFEFVQAKKKLLQQHEDNLIDELIDRKDNSLGEAANRYVTFQIVMGVIGLIIFLIVFFSVIAPHFGGGQGFGPHFP